MSGRQSRMVESLTRQPLSRTIAARKSPAGKPALLPVLESEYSPSCKTGGSVSHYSLSPSKSVRSVHEDVENVPPEAYSEVTHMAMTDNAADLRQRMEAELIALRRAQSIFAESHPSVDVHAKLQDLQEMYIGDLLVKDCQISQLRNQLETLMSEKTVKSSVSTPSATSAVPPPHASMLAARVQSLQKAVSQERHRRMEVEHRLEEVLKSNESSGANGKAELSRLTSSHRLEVHQLKSRLSQLSEANKELQTQLAASAVPAPAGAVSPASSSVGSTEKVAYVKYAQLRAEKRQIEAKLTTQIEELNSELEKAKSSKTQEIEKLEDHHRRVVQDLERKTRLAQQSRSEEGKELKELRPLYEKTLSEKLQIETLNFEYKRRIEDLERDLRARERDVEEITESEKFLALELEDREKVIAQLESASSKFNALNQEIEKLKEERMDLLEKIEEREDMLKSLQDSSQSFAQKISELETKLAQKDKEVAAMVAQADELDSLLSRADQDVTSSRLKIQALTAELEAMRTSSGASNSELKLKIVNLEEDFKKLEFAKRNLQDELSDKSKEIQRLEQEMGKTNHRLESLIDERDRLTTRLEQILASPKKTAALVDAEKKIGQLERELDSMRRAIEFGGSSGNDDSLVLDDRPRQLFAQKIIPESPSGKQDFQQTDESYYGQLTERVAKAESLFHEAVDVCTDAEFETAVSLLEQAAKTLASLPKEEIDQNDPDTLRVLESDIYGQLGVAFQCLSQVPEAIQAYATAVEVDPEAHACHANLAVLLQHQSRLKEAEEHANDAVRLAPKIEEYQQLLAQIQSADLEFPQALMRHSTRW